MPTEVATYTNDLVPTNPAQSDPLAGAAGHMRMIKGALKATFPNFTSGALNSTQAQIDAAVSATANGISVLADAGVAFKTNSTDGITNPAAGEIDLKLAGNIAARFVYTSSLVSVTFNGSLTTTGAITGPGVVPIGGMVMWLSDTLPTVGSWCWANGGVLSRTGNGAALYAITGTQFGGGDGSTTFNVINMQEVVPVGKSTMGGGGSPGLLPSISSSAKAVLGVLFGADTHTLTAAEIPQINSNVGVSGTLTGSTSSVVTGAGGSATGGGSFACIGTVSYSAASVTVSGSMSGSASSNNTSGLAHANTQPSRPVNYIIRIG